MVCLSSSGQVAKIPPVYVQSKFLVRDPMAMARGYDREVASSLGITRLEEMESIKTMH